MYRLHTEGEVIVSLGHIRSLRETYSYQTGRFFFVVFWNHFRLRFFLARYKGQFSLNKTHHRCFPLIVKGQMSSTALQNELFVEVQ